MPTHHIDRSSQILRERLRQTRKRFQPKGRTFIIYIDVTDCGLLATGYRTENTYA